MPRLNADLRDYLCWRSVKQSYWLDDDDWQRHEAPADILSDLRTNGNELSVFFIPRDNAARATRVATAMAANKSKLDHYEYILFEAAALEPIVDEHVRPSAGDTPDQEVNRLHRDLIELSAGQVANIANAMWQARDGLVRLLQADVERLVADAIKAGQIDRARVKTKILNQLQSSRLID